MDVIAYWPLNATERTELPFVRYNLINVSVVV